MKKIKTIILAITVLLILLLGYLLREPALNYLSDFLSKSEHVDANMLIVEGWLPDYALEMAYTDYLTNSYDYIVTTGVVKPAEYLKMAENGYLIFYPGDRLKGLKGGSHSVMIKAYSELGEEHAAHFTFYVNDRLEGAFYADKKKRMYEVTWKGPAENIDSVMIHFDNDAIGDFGDRNLFVKELVIDGGIKIPYLYNSDYDMSALDGIRRVKNVYTHDAEIRRRELVRLGVDSSRITAVLAGSAKVNRTLTSALTFRDWLRDRKPAVKGINIISVGTHGRRTWMTYNHVLDKKYPIGIVSLPDQKSQKSNRYRILKTAREALGIIYYWIILLPY